MTDSESLQTPLDHAHADIGAQGEDPRSWLRFYGRLCDADLFVLLREEAREGSIRPAILPHEGQDHALAFDTEERIAAFAEGAAHWVALPGADLVGLLAREGLGLGLNLGVAPSAVLLPPDAISWLAGQLEQSMQLTRALPSRIEPPLDVPPALVDDLARRLAEAAGILEEAWLVQARYEDAPEALLLACIGVELPARAALSRSIAPAVQFAPGERVLDIVFLGPDDPALRALRSRGLRFEIPAPALPEPPQPQAPGSDPDKPPRLR